jgi:hypothetical protein
MNKDNNDKKTIYTDDKQIKPPQKTGKLALWVSTNNSLSYLIHIAKIFLGLCLLLCGIAMLVLPGQGIITIILGLSLLPFPGKNKVEQNLLGRKSVRSTLNWIRKKANKEPFIFHE